MAEADAAAREAEASTAQSRPQHGAADSADGSRTGHSTGPADVANPHVLERAGDVGSVVVSWTPLASSRSPTGPSRKSHGPYQGYTPPGCGTRPSAQCTRRWQAQSTVTGLKVFGKQDRSLVPRPLHPMGPVSYR